MRLPVTLFVFLLAACGGSSTASAPTDGGTNPPVDGALPDGGIAATWCTGNPAAFCGDFDDPLVAFRGWDGIAITGPGVFATAEATATSKPKLGRGSLAAITQGSNGGHALVKKTLALAGKKRVTIDLALEVGDAQPQAGAIVRVLGLDIGPGSIGLFRDSTKWFVSVYRETMGGPSATEPALASPFPTGRLTSTKLEVVLGNPDGRVTLVVDGAPLVDELLPTYGDAQPIADVAFVAGPSHVLGAISAFHVSLDDVTIVLAD
jgi:hypothetical protein